MDDVIRKPVSRIDHKRTHGYFARVYRAEWVGSKSFADQLYGSSAAALNAAQRWVTYADQVLPTIAPKPALKKSTMHVRSDSKGGGLRYYDVYLPYPDNDGWETRRFYFKTLDEQAVSREKASDLMDRQNVILTVAHRDALIAWYVEHDKTMQIIQQMWDDVKQWGDGEDHHGQL